MNADIITTLAIVTTAIVFFVGMFVREWYLDYQADKSLLEYYKKIYTEMHK